MTDADTTENTTNEKTIHCYFWDPSSGASRNPGSKCKGAAESFVRVEHSGRLCPLCGPCKEGFISAQDKMPEDVRKSIPGAGKYVEVSLDIGADEFRKQPAKKSA